MKIKYTTPSGALCSIEIPKPEKELEDWQLTIHIRKELEKRFIQYKKFWKVGLDIPISKTSR